MKNQWQISRNLLWFFLELKCFDFFQLHLVTIDDDENDDDNENGDDDDDDDVQVHGLDLGQTRFVVNLE